MSDEKPKKSNQNDSRGGGNVWLVLIAIVSAVMLSAFLFGNTDRRIRYPDLMLLLERMAAARPADPTGMASESTPDLGPSEDGNQSESSNELEIPKSLPSSASATVVRDASDSTNHVKIVVPSTKNTESLVELSALKDIQVSDGAITGTVMYRTLGPSGKEPVSEAKRVDFQTIRDTNNESEHKRLVEYLEASGVTWDNARPAACCRIIGRSC